MRNNPRGIYLPTQVWDDFQACADKTNSVPTKHSKKTASIAVFLRRIGEDDVLLNAIVDYLNQPKQQQKFSVETLVIRPVSVKTESVARIIITNNVLSVIFPDKRDDFKSVIKEKLGFRWNGECWSRTIDSLNGNIADRAAETGHQLLAAGFCVILPNQTIQKNAITGSYQPECKRWILKRTEKDIPYFLIHWIKPHDYYKEAMRMTWAKYHDGIITVPFEHYAEVEDFAALHGFQFSDSAKELLTLAKTVRQNALVVDIPIKAQEKYGIPCMSIKECASETTRMKILSIPNDVGIDHELLDD